MVTYYISYGEPERPSFLRIFLILALGLLALAVLAGVAFGIYVLTTNDDGPRIPLPPSDTASSDAGAIDPVILADTLTSLFPENTNAYFLVDASKSIEAGGNLTVVQKALLEAVPYTSPNANLPKNSSAALVPFTDVPEPLSPPILLETPEGQSKWLTQMQNLKTSDRGAYIYDAVGAAHDALADLNDDKRSNTIILLTDGTDGGLQVVDPTKFALCPPGVADSDGAVCSPVTRTIAIDVDSLTKCPAHMGAAPGNVCHPVDIVSPGNNAVVYHEINPENSKSCPAALGGLTNVCNDIVTGYQPVDTSKVEPCPPGFAAPGSACIDFRSTLTPEQLAATLNTSPVPNLKVYIIGLGDKAAHASLELLAEAAPEGEYIPAWRLQQQ